MKIQVYTIKDLPGLLDSPGYRSAPVLPVSPERIRSYLANPRAEESDPVLFTHKCGDRIVAYRTVLPDRLYRDGSGIRFAWLSGNYVLPEHRRKGISTAMFKKVEEAWDGKLMYTNYAPASKAVYDRTGSFREFARNRGVRYYLRSSLETLLGDRVGLKPLLRSADRIISTLHRLDAGTGKYPVEGSIQVRKIDPAGSELNDFIAAYSGTSLFRRGVDEFRWILEYPWVTRQAEPDLPGSYGFSWRSEHFINRLRMLSDAGGNRAFLWTMVHGPHMKVPYFMSETPLLSIAARQIVIRTMIRDGASYLTIHHPGLGPVLGTRKNPFLFRKKMDQRFFVHASLADEIPAEPVIYDGDGDGVFS